MGRLQRDTEPAGPCGTVEALYKLLGRHGNFRVLVALRGGEVHVTALAHVVRRSRSIVSRSLEDLKRHGLVAVRPEGNRRYYRWTCAVRLLQLNPRKLLVVEAGDGTRVQTQMPWS